MQTLTMETSAAPLLVRASSELMKNQATGKVLAAKPGMRAVRDANGHAILMWIEDGTLHAAMRSPTSKTGWRRCELTGGLGGHVHAFDVGQLADDRLIIAAVVAAPQGPARQLRVTSAMSNDVLAPAWDDMDGAWHARKDVEAGVIIESIRIGVGSARELPIAVAALRHNDSVEQYLVNIDARDDRWTWSKLELPSNAVGAIELAAGWVGGDRGVFALFDTSTDPSVPSTLAFTTLPDEIYGRSERFDFALDGRATSLAVVESTTPGNSDVYVAGEAMLVYPAASTDAPITLARKGSLPPIYALAVTQDATSVSVFAIAGDQTLVHGEGPRDTFATWSRPRELDHGVSSIAVVRGSGASELFMTRGGEIASLYQEPGQKLWKPMTLQIPSTEHAATFITYTTRIEVIGADRRPRVGADLELRADTVTHLFVNGELHVAGPMHAVPVTTDTTGALTVMIPVDDLSVTALRLRAAGGPDVEIRPSQDIEAELVKLDDLTPLAKRDVSPETLVAIRDATRGIMAASSKTTSGTRGLLRAVDERVHVLSFANGETRLRVHQDGLLRGVSSGWAPDWLDAAFVEAGNALAWMSEKLDDAADFAWRLAGDLVEVLVQIGAETVRFSFRSLEVCLRTVSWILEKGLGIDLSGLWKALGFIFDWSEIDQLRGDIVRDATAAISEVEPHLGAVAKRVDEILAKLHDYLPAPDASFVPASFADIESEADRALRDQPSIAVARSSPAANWALSHLLHNGFELQLDSFSKLGEVRQLAEGFLALWEALGDKREVLVRDLQDVVSGTMDLRAALAKLGSDAMFLLAEGLRALVAKAFSVAHLGLAVLRELITLPLPIPLFRAVFDRDLSLLDMVALTVAVPASITHRLVMGRPLVEPHRLLRAASDDLSYRRAWLYPFAAIVYDATNAVAAVIAAKAPKWVNLFDVARFSSNIVRLICGRPFEDGSRQFPHQYNAWLTYLGALLTDFALWTIVVVGVRVAKTDAGKEAFTTAMGRIRGVGIIITACVAMGYEGKTTTIDREVFPPDSYAHRDAEAKLGQNICYFLADLAAGVLNLVGSVAPPKALLVIGGFNGLAAAIATAINIGRVVDNQRANNRHANY